MKHINHGAAVTPDEERLAPKLSASKEANDSVARVLASETFRRSARLKSLLSYLWEHVSTGHPEDVTEQQFVSEML